ncbi:MAG: response regulator [Lachnospiraceae bacterium]|jgi:two-component system sensor histidine kinase/response regulator
MEHGKKRNAITRFLTRSFIGILIVSIFSFTWLGIYMNNKSHDAFHQIGSIYISGMSDQISRHFESVIELRFDQAKGLVSVVSSEGQTQEELYEELAYRADVRGFDYLALCSPEGVFETLRGQSIQPLNPDPFVEALNRKERRVAVGMDSDGNEVVLFGVDADYPMSDGSLCTGVVLAVPLEYITDFLSLEDADQMMLFCIIRDDGDFVINNPNMGFKNSDERLPDLLLPYGSDSESGYSEEAFSAALQNNQSYAANINWKGGEVKLYSIPLSNSEWNLISFMPYNQLNGVLETLNEQRTRATVLSCLTVLLLMLVVFIRYFQLTNMQIHDLEISRQQTAQANKAKSEFLANMSHDIRTPMNAIVGMTAIATAHIDDTEQVKNCLKKIALSSKQLLGLINDVLDMSKIESGKMTLSAENTSLKDLFDAIVSIMQPQIRTKKQSFNVQVDNVVTENVWCDGVRLNQVLLNILSNATKYTPEEGSIKLSISEEESPKGENFARIHIAVKDNGIGMKPEFLEKIFESYTRADGARVQKIEGTGLGMTITKYIVDAMEGSIEVESELDKGSEFRLTFDFEKAPSMEVDMVLPAWNMLVVDDDEFLCKSTIEVLKSFGIHAEWTLSGESAIELALKQHQKRNDYQIILLDWKLPGMNGIQVARELREHLGKEVPILLISAYDWSEFEAEAREAGISGFISKPLFKSALFYNLRKYMGVEELQDQPQDETIKLSGRRILLAEDNELNWEVANELLSTLGLELEWAEDGQLCLEKFEASSVGYYDLILMDIRMPHMTGYEATKAIRKLDRPDAASIPIIAMSADAFSEDIRQCMECGMNAHAAKPIDMAEITKLLERYLA